MSSFTSRLPLSRSAIDRDDVSRQREDLLDELWADASTLVLPLHDGSAPLRADGSLALVPPFPVDSSALRVYLGRTLPDERDGGGTPVVTVVVDERTVPGVGEVEWVGLRAVGAALPARDAGIFTEALAMANWHSTHRFSPRSGAPTTAARAGWVRVDPTDGKDVFPRTDAAIIVGVTDADDRLLLGANAMWAGKRYSLLAGFVEPGESLEAAVAREVHEESGLRVDQVTYLGSQPWPFPASLMVGFTARVAEGASTEPVPDGQEIIDLRWFSREELAASLDEIGLPGHASIARAIIEQWYGGPIEDGVEW